MRKNRDNDPKIEMMSKIFFIVVLIGLSLAIILETIIIVSRNRIIRKNVRPKYKYCVISNSNDAENRKGSLKHLHSMLRRIGYKKGSNKTNCNLLWFQNSHFIPLQDVLQLKPHQRANFFPGGEFMTSETLLPASKLKNNTLSSIIMKTKNNSSDVTLKNLIETKEGRKPYVRKFHPFLVDGHTFDIGVYVVITSVNPLRAYWYKGDALFRFCPTNFTVVDDNPTHGCCNTSHYLSTWDMPSLSYYYSILYHGMKDSFDIYARSEDQEPLLMWVDIQKAIAELLIEKEHYIVTAIKGYPSQDSFFEMLRFDVIVDEYLGVYELKVYRMPELDSVNAFQREYTLFYEQLLYNLFLLTGIARNLTITKENVATQYKILSKKHIAVFGQECHTICREDCRALEICKLCILCLNKNLKKTLLKAHAEHMRRGAFRRLVPPPMHTIKNVNLLPLLMPKNLSVANRLLHLWYQGKCNQDNTWCT